MESNQPIFELQRGTERSCPRYVEDRTHFKLPTIEVNLDDCKMR